MPNPYSLDLRERAVAAYESGNESYEDVARRFSIGVASLDRWVSRFRKTGSVAPLPRGGGAPSKVDEIGLNVLCELVEKDRDATRPELARAYREATGVELSVATVGRRLWQLGYSRKKKASTRRSATPSE